MQLPRTQKGVETQAKIIAASYGNKAPTNDVWNPIIVYLTRKPGSGLATVQHWACQFGYVVHCRHFGDARKWLRQMIEEEIRYEVELRMVAA